MVNGGIIIEYWKNNSKYVDYLSNIIQYVFVTISKMISVAELIKTEQTWEAYWKEGNFDALGELFTPRCVFTCDDGMITGREGKIYFLQAQHNTDSHAFY